MLRETTEGEISSLGCPAITVSVTFWITVDGLVKNMITMRAVYVPGCSFAGSAVTFTVASVYPEV